MFRPVPPSVRFPALEAEIGQFWRDQRIYEKSLARRAGAPRFVFYEGPPTANGMPHPGHCLTRAIKDLFPRYRTMRGYLCERKAGWDTHGLPVEVEVCKELGIHSKEEIEAYGVEKFIHKCQKSVWRYMREWEQLTRRIGFWVDLDKAYVTYHQSYIESVWWSLKNLFDRGLLYQGHKIVWWWAQGGTALSSGEVGQGYREVNDPSVYVKFPIVIDERAKGLGITADTSLLVWTTTPWTLPSNQFAAVCRDIDYSIVVDPENADARIIVATALESQVLSKVLKGAAKGWVVKQYVKGHDLIDLRYTPPFNSYSEHANTLLRWGLWCDPYEQFPLGVDIAQRVKDREQVHRIELKSDGACNWLRTWRIVEGDFVTLDSGTGAVHIAPAFGEVDYTVLQEIQAESRAGSYKPQLINAVAPNGKFTNDAPDYCRERWVKDCDKDICRDLRHRGLLFHQEQYLHDYPYCWRADEDPLIQYPRKSWFVRTTQYKDGMLANNQLINWLPDHIKEGRFGNFLETNVDWALSRERYWGTPLPIWVCDKTGQMEAVGSVEELRAKPGSNFDAVSDELACLMTLQGMDGSDSSEWTHLRVHKPYIDRVKYDSPFAPGARMERVSEVIDCWYDSGAMPFSQWGYPHENRREFFEQFPADFISEALDQTRGWFYSQLAISTLLFGEEQSNDSARPCTPWPHPFRNCIVLGLMLGEDGQKMSKSKRNYREPNEIFDRYGADALRWYFFANQPPWTSIRYSEQAIKESIPEFLLRLWNVYSFFVIYATIDGFDPAALVTGKVEQLSAAELAGARSYRPIAQRSELDRWILSELNRTALAVTERMDAYDNFAACGRITEFVDALSNWYVRRSRDRFWSEDKHDPDKLDAYWTLYECLLATSKLIAPFVPFISESLWQNLAVAEFGGRAPESVHLCDFPAGDSQAVDERLSQRMKLVREIVSSGRAARMGAKLKVRQPLAKVEVILVSREHQPWLEEHSALIAEELNVKQVEFAQRADQYISYTVLPDLKRLGPRLGKRLPALKTGLAQADAAALLATMESAGQVTLELPDGPVSLDSQDLQVRLQAKPGWAAAQGPGAVVVLSTELTPALISEGLARELVHLVQNARKDLELQYTDRIELGIVTGDAELRTAATEFADYIQTETLALSITAEPISGVEPIELKIGSTELTLYVRARKEEPTR